jgi:uncharacterized protein YecE (DUF72 family)
MERAELLGTKLGTIVFQLPPWWELNLPRLEEFLESLPRGRHYSFELRNATWRTEEVYRLLRKRNAAFCIFELAGYHTDFTLTANFTYVRLHGPGGAYAGSYDRATLERWAERIPRGRRICAPCTSISTTTRPATPWKMPASCGSWSRTARADPIE